MKKNIKELLIEQDVILDDIRSIKTRFEEMKKPLLEGKETFVDDKKSRRLSLAFKKEKPAKAGAKAG